MASAIKRQPCIRCDKVAGITTCGGCQHWFCTRHFNEHRQELATQMDHVGQEHDILQQDFNQNNSPHRLLYHIDDWEQRSIKKIQETAEEVRIDLREYLDHTKNELKTSLCQMSKELQSSRQLDDYTEMELQKWIEQLKELRMMLEKPSTIEFIDDDQTQPMIRLIQLKKRPTMTRSLANIAVNARWTQNGITIAGGYGIGKGLNQVSNPHGLHMDDDQTIYIADFGNQRIVEWKCGATSGQVIAGGNGMENGTNRLKFPVAVIVDKETDSCIISDRGNQRVMRWPRQNGTNGETIISNIDCSGLAMDDQRFLYVSDGTNNEVRRYRLGEMNGTVVAGGNGGGNHLSQLSNPDYIVVDRDHSVYVTDLCNHRVMKWIKGAKVGIIVAGGRGKGNNLTQLSYPRGVAVDLEGTVYVADFSNHRVMRWCNGATHGDVIVGGNGEGDQPNQLKNPEGLAFDRHGNLYVADRINNRVQRFNIEPS